MKKSAWILILVLSVLCASSAVALAQPFEEKVEFHRRNLGGPRFGVTYITGHGELWDDVQKADVGRVVSQFGWHFERQVIPKSGGPQFVVELVPMVAAVEYGRVAPSITGVMGIRFQNGFELGMGPNSFVSRWDDSGPQMRTSLVLAVGKSFNYGGVSIPTNVAFTTNPEGNRVSLVLGYAIASMD